jgi:HK97 family phage prohead protease
MPYFITNDEPTCAGWATVKENGEVIGCHMTKQEAVDQMVAVSLSEGMEPGGERALPDNYRPAVSPDVPDGRACGNCFFYDESNVQGDRAWCRRWDEYVDGGYYCNAWQPDDEDDDDDDDNRAREVRAINVPDWIRSNARRGIEWFEAGYAGDGLTARTVREARDMAAGQISDDKAVRMAAWFARHQSDLEGTDRDTDPPTPGMVAHALWGGWPADESRRARVWAEQQVEAMERQDRHMGTKVETRHVTVNDFEIRETGDGMSFTGYAAVFDSPSEPLPWTETIRAGAFAKSIRSRNNVMMLWSHDTSQPLASTRSKTLRLSEDERGLKVEADLPQTTLGRDVAELLRAGVVDSMSFGFSVPRNGDAWSDDGMLRELREVRLHEVSIVAFPAYPKTSASVRSLDAVVDATGADGAALSSALDALEAGALTRDQATLLTDVVVKLSPPGDPDEDDATDEPDVQARLSLLKDMLDLAYKAV